MGSIVGYAIKYIPTIWEKPFDRPTPSYERLIIINLSYGQWLMLLIIVLIFLSISKLYEEKQEINNQAKAETRLDIEAQSEGIEEGKQ